MKTISLRVLVCRSCGRRPTTLDCSCMSSRTSSLTPKPETPLRSAPTPAPSGLGLPVHMFAAARDTGRKRAQRESRDAAYFPHLPIAAVWSLGRSIAIITAARTSAMARACPPLLPVLALAWRGAMLARNGYRCPSRRSCCYAFLVDHDRSWSGRLHRIESLKAKIEASACPCVYQCVMSAGQYALKKCFMHSMRLAGLGCIIPRAIIFSVGGKWPQSRRAQFRRVSWRYA